MPKTKGKDYYPNLEKTEVARRVLEILELPVDKNDFSEETTSGGGGTCSKQAWGKVLKKLEELKAQVVI